MSKYQPGDYVKVEFPDEKTGIGEWMWVRVDHCDGPTTTRLLCFGQRASERPWRQDQALGTIGDQLRQNP